MCEPTVPVPGHPGDGAVGHGACQLEHGGAERGDEDGRRGRAADVERGERVRGHPLARAPRRFSVQQGHEGGQVLAHVGGGLLVAQPPHPLDDDLVGEPDAEEQPVVGGRLHRQRLLGQHHRVAGVDGHDPGSQPDARHLGAGRGQPGQRVGAEDLRGERVVEAGIGEPAQLGHRRVERLVQVQHRPDAQRLGHGSRSSSPSVLDVPAPVSTPIATRRRVT